jgi:hypothetical protein
LLLLVQAQEKELQELRKSCLEGAATVEDLLAELAGGWLVLCESV